MSQEIITLEKIGRDFDTDNPERTVLHAVSNHQINPANEQEAYVNYNLGEFNEAYTGTVIVTSVVVKLYSNSYSTTGRGQAKESFLHVWSPSGSTWKVSNDLGITGPVYKEVSGNSGINVAMFYGFADAIANKEDFVKTKYNVGTATGTGTRTWQLESLEDDSHTLKLTINFTYIP